MAFNTSSFDLKILEQLPFFAFIFTTFARLDNFQKMKRIIREYTFAI